MQKITVQGQVGTSYNCVSCVLCYEASFVWVSVAEPFFQAVKRVEQKFFQFILCNAPEIVDQLKFYFTLLLIVHRPEAEDGEGAGQIRPMKEGGR